MREAYSTMKPARHLDRITELRAGRHPMPVHLQVSPSDLCNQDCNFCAYRASDGISTELFGVDGNFNPKRMIPFEKMLEVLDDCVEMGVRAVQYQGGGEPTTHPRIADLFAETVDRGVEAAMVTNGLKMGDSLKSVLVDRGSWIRISLDAGSPETYSRIRRTPVESFNRVLRNVGDLVERRDRGGRPLAISLGFVITRDNWAEIPEALAVAQQLKVDMIRFTPAIVEGESEVPWDRVRDLVAETRAASASGRTVVYFSGEERVDGTPESDFCGYQYFTPYLGGDQSLYRCCLTTYTSHGYIGSVSDQRFRDMWRSEATRRTMTAFKAREACFHCKFKEQNQLIEYLAGPETRFDNFV